MELSIVIPCLNEEDTLGVCLEKAKTACDSLNIVFEIIVADNGSTDKSLQICEAAGVKVVNVPIRGYGSALQSGIKSAKGKYIIMGDADDSYNFLEIPKFYNELTKGFDIVQGCRLPAGGGKIEKNAMPISHRYIGNPLFSFLARWWFKAPINDIYCGLRGFSREYILQLDIQSNGMEFATEMLIKASLRKANIREVPITLHKDGRISHPPHLKTFRDGWRTLRFFLLYAPIWLYLAPSLILVLLSCVALAGFSFQHLDIAWPIMFIQLTFFTLYLFVLTQIYIAKDGLIPPVLKFKYSLEHGLGIGFITILSGIIVLPLHLLSAMFVTSIGIQIVLGSFFASMLGEASFKRSRTSDLPLQILSKDF